MVARPPRPRRTRVENQGDELGLGFAHPVADLAEEPGREPGKEMERACRDSAEERKPQVIVGEHDAKREHGAEVVCEAGSEDDLSESRAIETRLDHDGIDDCY